MREHLPWLCQGDIFADAPVMDVVLTESNELSISLPTGPTVLLTHDCAMDKANRNGEPRAERLQFARLRAIDVLPPDQRRTLRGGQRRLEPYEAMYLGEISDFGESFILLTDPYYLPAGYFMLGFEDYSSHPDGEPGARYVIAQAHDTRLGRLDEAQVELLRRKMLAFWARVRSDDPVS